MSVLIASEAIRQLPDGNVHVWTAWVSEAPAELDQLDSLLSPAEKSARDRLARPVDRRRYVVAHGLLRQLLGRYLARDPAALEFTAGEFGKPELATTTHAAPVSFNLAHSGDAVVLAFAAGGRVGADVEAVRPELKVMELAASHFSPAEIAALAGLSETERTEAFFRCWTRKEAYLKARGEGLNFPLRNFTVSVAPGDSRGLLWVADDPGAPGRWAMYDLTPAVGYRGAVVVEGRCGQFESHQYHWRPGAKVAASA
jgi:4'-phosphopantetheinyl transferase